ncbi:MAG: type II toxin-antitoxin system death-on-curing family toxin [Pirellulales bacterium]
MSLEFLSLEDIIALHRDQIARYGGLVEIRDWSLLKSAAAMPMASFAGQYLHADICEMAAAYLFHLVQNHPFLDGNKRVGTVAADVFLALNGFELAATRDELFDLVLSVARGETSKSAVAEFFRANVKVV